MHFPVRGMQEPNYEMEKEFRMDVRGSFFRKNIVFYRIKHRKVEKICYTEHNEKIEM